MSMDEERLRKLYDEKDNDALADLWEHRDDLTDVAQSALESVMRERRLPTNAESMPEALREEGDGEDTLSPNEILLWAFDDMFQAKRAIQLLDDAEVEYKLIDRSKNGVVGNQSRRGPLAWLQLVVNERDYESSRQLLHNQMGLFPKPEGDAPSADAAPLDDLVGVFLFDVETDLSDGIAAAHALAEKGVSFLWHDGRDSPEGLADEGTASIEVRPEAAERAAAIIDARLAVLPKRR
jgi:hypothetical protein